MPDAVGTLSRNRVLLKIFQPIRMDAQAGGLRVAAQFLEMHLAGGQAGSYLASSEGVTIDTKWSGAKTFFGSEGLIMLKVSGNGTLIVSSYGALHPVELLAGQNYVIDSGHLVTFEEQVGFKVKAVAGWKSTLFSGEGLVVELTGPGKLNLKPAARTASWPG